MMTDVQTDYFTPCAWVRARVIRIVCATNCVFDQSYSKLISCMCTYCMHIYAHALKDRSSSHKLIYERPEEVGHNFRGMHIYNRIDLIC